MLPHISKSGGFSPLISHFWTIFWKEEDFRTILRQTKIYGDSCSPVHHPWPLVNGRRLTDRSFHLAAHVSPGSRRSMDATLTGRGSVRRCFFSFRPCCCCSWSVAGLRCCGVETCVLGTLSSALLSLGSRAAYVSAAAASRTAASMWITSSNISIVYHSNSIAWFNVASIVSQWSASPSDNSFYERRNRKVLKCRLKTKHATVGRGPTSKLAYCKLFLQNVLARWTHAVGGKTKHLAFVLFYIYTGWANIDRFSKFFHWHTLRTICNNVITVELSKH